MIDCCADHFSQPLDCFHVAIFEFAMAPQFEKTRDLFISDYGKSKHEWSLCSSDWSASLLPLLDALANRFLADVNFSARLESGVSAGSLIDELFILLQRNGDAACGGEEARPFNQQLQSGLEFKCGGLRQGSKHLSRRALALVR